MTLWVQRLASAPEGQKSETSLIAWFSAFVHDLVHQIAGLDYPDSHWWLDITAALVFVIAPAWTGWLALRAGLRWLTLWRRRRARRRIIMSGRAMQVGQGLKPLGDAGIDGGIGWRLETYVVRATFRFQLRLAALSLLTLPAAWLLLEIPKHIINHALADADGNGHPEMTFLGLHLDRVELLLALCSSYLAVLTASGLTKYAANRVRGRVNERVVRRLRLAILRRARLESSPEQRATLAAVAVQEVEPVGYFGGSVVVVPLIQGGTFLTSIIFFAFAECRSRPGRFDHVARSAYPLASNSGEIECYNTPESARYPYFRTVNERAFFFQESESRAFNACKADANHQKFGINSNEHQRYER